MWCFVVDCSFECVTESSDSTHAGAVDVTVSGMYSTASEDHFTFEVGACYSSDILYNEHGFFGASVTSSVLRWTVSVKILEIYAFALEHVTSPFTNILL